MQISDWINAGYKLYQHQSYMDIKYTDTLLQKAIYKDDKLYFINVWVYHPNEVRNEISFFPEVQYNTHMDQGPCFNIQLLHNEESIEEIEEFFQNVYNRMNCQPYGN